jgi:hypothetical protein
MGDIQFNGTPKEWDALVKRNKMKHTAIEWLEEHIKNVNWIDKELSERMDIIQQAKEMEKEQIIDAYQTSHISMMTAEQYYNENYKNKEQ